MKRTSLRPGNTERPTSSRVELYNQQQYAKRLRPSVSLRCASLLEAGSVRDFLSVS